VYQEDDVKVCSESLRHSSHAIEGGSADECRATVKNVLDPLTIIRRDDPVTDRHVGSDIADPQWLFIASGLGHRTNYGAPTAV
jgi:hypothetical protein